MPVLIGAKPESTFADPIGLLGDCHRRIEMFLSVLCRIAVEAAGAALTADQKRALHSALVYFREAAPKHTADEEVSLFPRLRAMDRADLHSLLSKVDALEQDHVAAGKAHEDIDHLGSLWLSNGALTSEQISRLQAVLTQLSELYRQHISIEDQEVFPIADSVLAAPDKQSIGLEMAARRGLKNRE